MGLYKTLFAATIVSISLLSGCSWFSGGEDVVKISPLPEIQTLFTPQQLWATSVGSGIGKYYSHLHPVAQGDKIYAADRQGKIAALDANTGKTLWSVNLAGKAGVFSTISAQLSGGLSIKGNRLYVGSEKAVVYCLAADTGAVIWKTAVAGEVLSTPVVAEGVVLIHTSNGRIQALAEKTGKIQWTVDLDMPTLVIRGESSPAVAQGAAIVGGNNGRVSVLALNNGQMIWQQFIAVPRGGTEIDRLNDVNTTPVVGDNIVYAVAYNGNLVALDLRSGEILWQRDIGSVNNFILRKDVIYLVDQNDMIFALNASNGKTLWTQGELLHRELTAPTWYSDYLVVADNEGYLHWIDPSKGTFVSRQKVDSSGFLAKPLVDNGKLILQARSGKLYAFSH